VKAKRLRFLAVIALVGVVGGAAAGEQVLGWAATGGTAATKVSEAVVVAVAVAPRPVVVKRRRLGAGAAGAAGAAAVSAAGV
jgi:hypothetical protein